nr:reverse transcriptase domain-containing protein [Tanacetum cinerariifolium]GEY25104.1 reverse transcriptase domain-containing protein [Tanacetum cinerariifolium]
MPPRMRTRSAGRPTNESLGGRTGVRVGRRGRGKRPKEGNDERIDDLNGQGNDQGIGANGVYRESMGMNVLVNGNWEGCSYKEFLACNPKEYDERCPSHEMQKLETELWNHAMVGAGHAVYTDRFHKLVRLVPHLVTLESRKIERNGSIKKVEKRGNVWELSKDKNGKGDNKRTRTGNAFATTANTACYECGSTDHVSSACPRWNRAQGSGGNRLNQVVANNEGQGRGNQENQARGRAFMLGAREAHQDPNIVTGMDWLSKHKAEIICHEKVARTPLLEGKVLRVL